MFALKKIQKCTYVERKCWKRLKAKEMFSEIWDAIHQGLGNWRKAATAWDCWLGSNACSLPEGLVCSWFPKCGILRYVLSLGCWVNDREQNSSLSNKHNKPSACWCRVAKLLYLNPPLSCLQEGEAEEKQLEGQREVLQKAQVKRKRYEGVSAQFWAWRLCPQITLPRKTNQHHETAR